METRESWFKRSFGSPRELPTLVVGASDTGARAAQAFADTGREVIVVDHRFVGSRHLRLNRSAATVVMGSGCSVLVGAHHPPFAAAEMYGPTSERSPAWPRALRTLDRSGFDVSRKTAEIGLINPDALWFDLADARPRRKGPFQTGPRIRPVAARVVSIEQPEGSWVVHGIDRADSEVTWTVSEVVLAAGSFGTTEILLRSAANGLQVSNCLGERFCANASAFAWSPEDVVAWIESGDQRSESQRSESESNFQSGPRGWGDRAPRPGRSMSPFRDIIPVAVNEDFGYSRLVWDEGVRVDWYERQPDQVLGAALQYVPFSSQRWRHLPVSVLPTGGCCAAEAAEDGVVNGAGQVFCAPSGSEVYAGLSVVDSSIFSMPEPEAIDELKSAVCEHVVAAALAQREHG